MSSIRKFLFLSLLVLLPGVSQAANAEAEARIHFDQGQKLTAQARYSDAISEFAAGWDLSHKPLFLFNIAECARLAGERERARMNYQLYLEKDPQGKLVAKARERLAELEPKPAPTPVATPTPAPVVAPAATPAVAATAPAPVAPVAPVAPAPSVAVTSPATASLTATPVEAHERKPVWKSTGFWVGISVGAAVLIAGATTAGVLATRSSGGCSSSCIDLR